jgi:hypothetical protein
MRFFLLLVLVMSVATEARAQADPPASGQPAGAQPEPAAGTPAAAQPDPAAARPASVAGTPAPRPEAGTPEAKAQAAWHFQAAKAAFLARRLDEALGELSAVMELDPQPVVMFNIARIHEEKGENDKAVEWYLRALRSGLSGEMAAGATARAEVLSRIQAAKAEEAKQKGEISIELDQAEAKVFIDSTYVGQGALRGYLAPPGKHVVTIDHPSFEKWNREIELAGGQKLVVDVALVPLPQVGFVSVHSDVPGATLAVDGQPLGLLPVDRLQLSPGKHRFSVQAERFNPFATELEVRLNESTVINVALTPLEVSGKLLVESEPAGALVEVDGKPIGNAPVLVEKLSAGTHSVAVSLAGHETQVRDVRIPENQMVLLPVTLLERKGSKGGASKGGTGGKSADGEDEVRSYISLVTGFARLPSAAGDGGEGTEGGGSDDSAASPPHRDYVVLGVHWGPDGFKNGVRGRFWLESRLPVYDTADGVTSQYAVGGGMSFDVGFGIANRVGVFAGAGAQYFLHFPGKDEDGHKVIAWHDVSFPIGGGAVVRIWKGISAVIEGYWVVQTPELAGSDLDERQMKRHAFSTTLGAAWAW